MFYHRLGWLASVFVLGLASHPALAGECLSYAQMQAKLGGNAGEQLIFSGFEDSAGKPSANAIYEFWANPRQGNWSLVVQELMLLRNGAVSVTKNCVSAVVSGHQHHLIAARRNSARAAPGAAEVNSVASAASGHDCIPRDRYAAILQAHQQEAPIIRALTDEGSVVEIYAGAVSWTIANTEIRKIRDDTTGTPLTDATSGQEIHELCSAPAFSGKSWGLFTVVDPDI
ncbi:MAG: hypothetical protein U1F68_00285 [Gammaproteobacteria bacterium]